MMENQILLHFLFSINQKKWVKGKNIEDLNSNLKKLVEDSENIKY